MNPLAFLIGSNLLGGSGAASVLELIITKGEPIAKDLLHGAATDLLNARAERISAKMTSDGWHVGGTHKGTTIDPAAQVHDVLYRITALFIPRGGFLKDQIRDATDHAIGAGLVGTVPPDPTPDWVRQVGGVAISYWFSLLP